jgi:hypothetical protein
MDVHKRGQFDSPQVRAKGGLHRFPSQTALLTTPRSSFPTFAQMEYKRHSLPCPK